MNGQRQTDTLYQVAAFRLKRRDHLDYRSALYLCAAEMISQATFPGSSTRRQPIKIFRCSCHVDLELCRQRSQEWIGSVSLQRRQPQIFVLSDVNSHPTHLSHRTRTRRQRHTIGVGCEDACCWMPFASIPAHLWLCICGVNSIRLYRMHEMQSILTDVRGVCQSRGSSRLHCAKMAQQIKMLFGVNILEGQWNTVLDVGPGPLTGRGSVLNFGTSLVSPEGLKLET